jgi:hypothetical protein
MWFGAVVPFSTLYVSQDYYIPHYTQKQHSVLIHAVTQADKSTWLDNVQGISLLPGLV